MILHTAMTLQQEKMQNTMFCAFILICVTSLLFVVDIAEVIFLIIYYHLYR